VTSSGRPSKKPIHRQEYIEDFEDNDVEEEDDEEGEGEEEDESDYSEEDAINDEYRIKSEASHDGDIFNYDIIKKNLMKTPGTVDITGRAYVKIIPSNCTNNDQHIIGLTKIGSVPN
jgi:hypothetical protein